MVCKTLLSFRQVQTGFPRELAKLLTGDPQPSLVFSDGGNQADDDDDDDDAFYLFLQKQQVAYQHIPIGYPRERQKNTLSVKCVWRSR